MQEEDYSYARQLLKEHGLSFEDLERIDHADTLSSTVFSFTSGEKQLVLKLFYNEDRFRRESYYLSLLEGKIPVAKMVESEKPSGKGKCYILMEKIKGEILTPASLTEELAFQMGEILASLHEIEAPFFGDLSLLKSKMSSSAKKHMQIYFERSFGECKEVLDKALLKRCSQYVEENISCFESVGAPCIVHRDYRPGNVMAYQGKVQAVIDFENTMGSFAEEDFVQMEFLTWKRCPEYRESFFEGYRKVRALPALERVLPLLHVLKSLAAIGFTIERGTWKSLHQHVFTESKAALEELLK